MHFYSTSFSSAPHPQNTIYIPSEGSVNVKPGAMLYCQDVTVETGFQDSLFAVFKRFFFGGESFLLNTYKATEGKKGLVKQRTELVRLSDVGEKLLNDLSEAPVEEEDERVFEWLKDYYLKAEKEIGVMLKILLMEYGEC